MIQIQPIIRDETGEIYFCNTLFHESFLTQDQSAEKWLLSQRDFYELISVTEMGSMKGMSIRIFVQRMFLFRTDSETISVQSFLNGHRNIILWQFYDAAHVRHKDSYNQKTIVSDDIKYNQMSDDSSVSSYVNDVFYLYSTGISHNAIARILNISISTSKKHASLICDYFSVSNKDELIILLYNKKFIHYLYEKAMCIINMR
ncbi:conjugal transfer transcriptional regulator TraJ (plasmid) [Escherichia coli]